MWKSRWIPSKKNSIVSKGRRTKNEPSDFQKSKAHLNFPPSSNKKKKSFAQKWKNRCFIEDEAERATLTQCREGGSGGARAWAYLGVHHATARVGQCGPECRPRHEPGPDRAPARVVLSADKPPTSLLHQPRRQRDPRPTAQIQGGLWFLFFFEPISISPRA